MDISDLSDYPAVAQIADALWGASDVRGAAVMVGSGFSRFAEMPAGNSPLPPLWADFHSAITCALYNGEKEKAPRSPLRSAEEYRTARGAQGLDALVRSLVRDQQWQPGSLHRKLLRLPWSDVLTTNWDTLLERTIDPDSEHVYETVLTPGDIARTRPPRIVKLHGTFPSLSPFIFTEEDYRTYPREFAPFVNLAQQTLLENELCLLGFSGDDPNFLAWSGWVRDHLGKDARRIYLVGVFDMPQPQRRMLEQRNVAIVDLAPLVADIDPRHRHQVANLRFLEVLYAAKPTDPWRWNRREGERIDDKTPLEELVRVWRQERKSYPGWLVAPHIERYRLYHDTYGFAGRIAEAVSNDSLSGRLRCDLAAELVWRAAQSLSGLPDFLVAPLEQLLRDHLVMLGEEDGFAIFQSLLQNSRERRDESRFNTLLAFGETHWTSEDVLAHLAYERCLWARQRLDYPSMMASVEAIKGSDPLWAFRKAQILAELGRGKEAGTELKSAYADLKLRRLRDRRSLWLLSRQAWANFMVRNVWFDEPDEGESPFEEWPTSYAAAKCDPWDELHSLQQYVDGELKREKGQPKEDIALFDPGMRRRAGRTFGNQSVWTRTPFGELSRFVEAVGFVEFHRVNTLKSTFEQATRLLPHDEPQSAWATMLALANREGRIDEAFSRIAVARLEQSLVEDMANQLRAAINFGSARFWKNEPDSEGEKPSTDWIEEARLQLEILSRLVLRLDAEAIGALFNWGCDLARQPDLSHWWLFEPLSHLLSRALQALPPAERAVHFDEMLAFPLVGEKPVKGIERDWPDFGEEMLKIANQVERPAGQWDARVAELISRVRSGHQQDRSNALVRLLALKRGGHLSQSERAAMVQAIWAVPGGKSLPRKADLYDFAWLELAADDFDRVKTAFVADVIEPLREGKLDDRLLRSLAQIGRKDYLGPPLVVRVETAREIIDHIMAWRPKEQKNNDPWFGVYEELPFAAAWAMHDTLMPTLTPAYYNEDLCDALLNIAREGIYPHLSLTLGFVGVHAPAREQAVIKLMRRNMVARDRDIASLAVQGSRTYARLARKNGKVLPSVLATDIASLCGARHDASLHSALYVARDLVEHDEMSELDIERLDQALDLLLFDTDYRNQGAARLNVVTLTLVRSECVRLASVLLAKGHDSEAIQEWIAWSKDDPLPEVRFAMTEQS